MTNLEKAARTYRLPETTTPENLACRWTCNVNFGKRFLVAGYDDLSCEGEIRLIAVSEERFEDNGHALAWAMQQ